MTTNEVYQCRGPQTASCMIRLLICIAYRVIIGLESGAICHRYLVYLAYADDVNLIGDDARAIERNADVLLNPCKDIGLAVNTGKTKYI